jgi:hypothetical protein
VHIYQSCTNSQQARDHFDPLSDHPVVFPKERQVTRHASFLRYPSRSKNKLFLWSDTQKISDVFDLEACPASLIWRSFGNTTVFNTGPHMHHSHSPTTCGSRSEDHISLEDVRLWRAPLMSAVGGVRRSCHRCTRYLFPLALITS